MFEELYGTYEDCVTHDARCAWIIWLAIFEMGWEARARDASEQVTINNGAAGRGADD
jgi:hypothetical protein